MRATGSTTLSSGFQLLLYVGVALVALPACGSLLGAPEHSPLLRTSAVEYEVKTTPRGYIAHIPFTFTNRTGGPVHLPTCRRDFAPAVQRETSEGPWEGVWGPIHNDCLSIPITVVPPGGTLQDTLVLFAAPAQGEHPAMGRMGRLHDELAAGGRGTYRLVWLENQALTSFDPRARPAGRPLPLAQRVSNPFTLRVR
jgi:hypothetical protein